MPTDFSKYGTPVTKSSTGVDFSKYGTLSSNKASVAPAKPAQEVKGGLVGEILTGNTQRFGKTIGEAVAAPENAQKYSDVLQSHTAIQNDLLKTIAAKKKMGQDTSRLEAALANHVDSTPKLEDFTGDVIHKSAEKVIGEGLGTGLEALSGGLLGGESKALGAKALTTGEKIVQGAKVAAPYAAAGGFTSALQQEKDAAGVLADTAKAGIAGGVLGGGIGAVGGLIGRKAGATIGENAAAKIEKATGQVLQGDAKDVSKGIKVLSNIDTKGVKTYGDLASKLDEKVAALSNSQDKLLENSLQKTKLNALNAVTEIEGKAVKHNFVKDALSQLQEFYRKTNDIEGQVKMKNLISKAQKDGLTTKEVNDLAKLHGQTLNGFNANGELASGLTKQAAENTRAGLKTTVRMTGGKPSELIDRQISDTIRVRDLTKDVDEKVNALKQRIQPYSLGNKVGRLVFNALDMLTFGGAKGAVSAALPRGVGYKTLNALDLEKALSGNLKTINKISSILETAGKDTTFLDKIQEILNKEVNVGNAKLPTKPPLLKK